ADEAEVDLAVFEELFAPRVEQHPVRGAGDLHPLRHQAGHSQRRGRLRVGVEVAAARIRADEVLGDLPLHTPFHHAAPRVWDGVNVTHDVHRGRSEASAVITATSMSTYSRPRFS